MTEEHIWLETEEGTIESIPYQDLSEQDRLKFWRPTGKFSYSASSFLNLPLPEVPFYLKDWLPEQGKAELYGQAKAGKSFLCLQLARCIGAGEPFLGIPTRQGKVLYLQFELGTGVLQWRMRQTGMVYDNVYVGTTFAMKLDKKVGQDVLKAELDAIEPKVLILDPFYKILSGDENVAQDVEVIIDFLDEMIDAYGISVLIAHHSGKDMSRGGRGSSVLEGWVESYIEMKKGDNLDGTHRARIKPKLLRHAANPPEGLEIVLGDDFEFHLGDKPTTVRDRVRVYFEEHKVTKVQEMVNAGVGSRRMVNDAKNDLVTEGVVVQAARGVYEWKN